jgi:hypothetical protein
MPKICFLYTDTNGLHKTNEFVSTKNLYKFARLIAVHYIIGDYENGVFKNPINKTLILKPKTINFDKVAQGFHKITMEDAQNNGIDNNKIITELKNDLNEVKIIISYSLAFHVKAIQVECFRTAIEINFGKYILIDMSSFGHSFDYPKFADMLVKYNINKKLTQIEQFRDLFLSLYKNYLKAINDKKNSDECDFVD